MSTVPLSSNVIIKPVEFMPPNTTTEAITEKADNTISIEIDSQSDNIIAGAFSGTVSRMITAPLDVLKIRSQLHFQGRSPSMLNSFRDIVKEEGVLALWKGNLSATYLWITYGMAQFFFYGILKTWGESAMSTIEANPDKYGQSSVRFLKPVTLFLAGAGAGMGATAVTYPFDIMRTQFAVQGNIKTYANMRSFITSTINSRGLSGFYAGLPTALIGIGPYMGLNFALYETMKQLSANQLSYTTADRSLTTTSVLTMIRNALCGGAAGGLSKLAIYPLDTVKRRMQMQVLSSTLRGAGTTPTYPNSWVCLTSTVQNEGFLGLYKGIGPTLVKAVFATGITFAAFEVAKDFLHWRRKNTKDVLP